MRLTRKQSMVAALALIAAFFAAGVWQQRRPLPNTAAAPAANREFQAKVSAAEQLNAAAEQQGLQLPDAGGSQVTLHDFRRSETKDGHKLWEVSAAAGRFFPEKNMAIVSDARMQLNRDRTGPLLLTARQAVLELDGAAVRRAEFSGGVELQAEQGAVLRAKRADYNHSEQTVHIPGAVKIESKLLDVTADGLDADLGRREFHFLSNVRTVVHPAQQRAAAPNPGAMSHD